MATIIFDSILYSLEHWIINSSAVVMKCCSRRRRAIFPKTTSRKTTFTKAEGGEEIFVDAVITSLVDATPVDTNHQSERSFCALES